MFLIWGVQYRIQGEGGGTSINIRSKPSLGKKRGFFCKTARVPSRKNTQFKHLPFYALANPGCVAHLLCPGGFGDSSILLRGRWWRREGRGAFGPPILGLLLGNPQDRVPSAHCEGDGDCFVSWVPPPHHPHCWSVLCSANKLRQGFQGLGANVGGSRRPP